MTTNNIQLIGNINRTELRNGANLKISHFQEVYSHKGRHSPNLRWLDDLDFRIFTFPRAKIPELLEEITKVK